MNGDGMSCGVSRPADVASRRGEVLTLGLVNCPPVSYLGVKYTLSEPPIATPDASRPAHPSRKSPWLVPLRHAQRHPWHDVVPKRRAVCPNTHRPRSPRGNGRWRQRTKHKHGHCSTSRPGKNPRSSSWRFQCLGDHGCLVDAQERGWNASLVASKQPHPRDVVSLPILGGK
jgi:hypothetical protein